MNILVDVDSTVLNLNEVWLQWYNLDYKDNLTNEDLTDWDMVKFVKPECGTKIYDYLKNPHLYDCVKPVEGAFEALNILRRTDRVIFVSSGIYSASKFNCLVRNKLAVSEKEFVVANDKSLIKGTILVDDGFHNIKDFPGSGILFTQPHNLKEKWFPRANSWSEVLQEIEVIKMY